MARDLDLTCTCGRLRGSVAGVTGNNARRLSCLCDDCQAYAHYLGRADEILDQYGGTDLSYATPNRVSFLEGREQLRCLRLTPHGLLRWYAGCCRTPVAHTAPSPRIAFVGLNHLALHRGDPSARDHDLGPLRVRVQARFAAAAPPPSAHPGEPAAMRIRVHASILWSSLLGRNRPSPFFGPSGAPVAEPIILGREARED